MVSGIFCDTIHVMIGIYSLASLAVVAAELPPFGAMLRRALILDPEIFAQIEQVPEGIVIALVVVALAGLSEAIGQSIVLFINRVSPPRFVLSILLSAGSHIIGYLFWTASIWLVGTHVFLRNQPLVTVASAVGLAYAPQLLGFFVLAPYLGSFFSLILSLWSLLAIIVAIQVGLDLSIGQALLCSGLGWLLIQAWRRTLGRPILAVGHWLHRQTVGVPLRWTINDISRIRLPARLRERVLRNRQDDEQNDERDDELDEGSER